jgi:hypothetical protein
MDPFTPLQLTVLMIALLQLTVPLIALPGLTVLMIAPLGVPTPAPSGKSKGSLA